MIRQPRYDQVLTGIVPYNRENSDTVARDAGRGVRPSRPTGLWRNQRLQNPVWDVIRAGWDHQPEQRCELSVMHNVLLTSGRREAELGDLNTRNNRNIMTAERRQTQKQGDNELENSSLGSPLSSSFCEIRNQKSRGASTRWIG